MGWPARRGDALGLGGFADVVEHLLHGAAIVDEGDEQKRFLDPVAPAPTFQATVAIAKWGGLFSVGVSPMIMPCQRYAEYPALAGCSLSASTAMNRRTFMCNVNARPKSFGWSPSRWRDFSSTSSVGMPRSISQMRWARPYCCSIASTKRSGVLCPGCSLA